MNHLYRFSPIKTKDELLETITYIACETTKLCIQVTGHEYPISSLTVFAHYPNEFIQLKDILLSMGKFKSENNGPFVELYEPIHLPSQELSLVRIRKPDPYRMQVGCNDFEIPSYENFKGEFLNKNECVRLIERPEYEMIEFFNPDFDVLAYIISKPLQ